MKFTPLETGSRSFLTGFTNQFLEKIKSLIDPKDIAYIILNHLEPDHSSSLPSLLKETKNATVVFSRTAEHFYKNIFRFPSSVPSLKVGDGDSLNLGNKTLKFISAPFLHWPDTMFTYLEEEKMRDEIELADGIIVGSPTICGDVVKPIWDILAIMSSVKVKGKKAAAFGSYGWSGEAVKLIEERLKTLKMKVVESGLRFSFMPTEEDLNKSFEFGKNFAKD